MGQNIPMFWGKTSGCFGERHPDVMGQNIPMFWGKTSGCFGERHPDVLHIKSYTVRG